MVIWIIGQSGSGKTFFSKKIISKLSIRKKVHIDGDEVREFFFNNKLGYKIKDRRKNADFIVNLCNYFEQKGFLVVCSIQNIFPEMQKKNRKFFKKYFQIYIKVPHKILMRRNNKDVYSKKNVVGMDFKFPKPYKSDYEVFNHFDKKYLEIVKIITKKIKLKLKKL